MSVTTSKKETLSYKASPLPFMGQKRNFSKKFMDELGKMPNDLIIIDLFGGSGILSHSAKVAKPDCRVIYNDFDNFQLRLKSIQVTNDLIAFARSILSEYPRNNRVPEEPKKQILKRIKQAQSDHGYIDYISLSSSFLFSGKYALSYDELAKEGWYNKVRRSDFKADGYLDGVELVCFDYRDLYNQFKDVEGVVFIIDPPYLQTQSTTYKEHWNLGQHLDTLTVLQADKFFYFTSSKSNIIELMDWLDSHAFMPSPFKYCKRLSHKQMVSGLNSYEDIMFVKG